MGKVHHQSGDIKAAIKYYQRAIGLKPDLTEVRDRLRQALQEEDGIKIKVSIAKHIEGKCAIENRCKMYSA
ncbi:tetratricopeptide repeat protein [Nostoc sp.]|uniref:tetratricopeptide repeat protein n=1 Tax=Nostoc sp. TaxID=1180 RepID=UPI002FF75F81